ncbi:MAG: hypothetical protein CMM50_04855 [Rhodospirillaceae bacterium]|nr:hypothetical protein [Rhodospirillaceae bacterium]
MFANARQGAFGGGDVLDRSLSSVGRQIVGREGALNFPQGVGCFLDGACRLAHDVAATVADQTGNCPKPGPGQQGIDQPDVGDLAQEGADFLRCKRDTPFDTRIKGRVLHIQRLSHFLHRTTFFAHQNPVGGTGECIGIRHGGHLLHSSLSAAQR